MLLLLKHNVMLLCTFQLYMPVTVPSIGIPGLHEKHGEYCFGSLACELVAFEQMYVQNLQAWCV